MKIIIKAAKLELTPVIQEYIEEKIRPLERFLKKFEEKNEIDVFVEVGRSTRHHHKGNVFFAEATLAVPEKILRAEYSYWDIRAAIDKVRDKLKQEIRKYKNSGRGATRKKIAEQRGKG